MNVISQSSIEFKFKKTDHIFSAIKSDLESFNQIGLIDETKFYRKIKRFLEELGTSIYKEKESILLVVNNVAYLLDDFSFLYAAYRCSCSNSESKTINKHFQNGWSFWLEDECQKYNDNKCCLEKGCWDEKINYRVRAYIGEEKKNYNFNSPKLLSVTNRVLNFCDNECLNVHSKCEDEISIDINSNKIFTNFNEGYIYLQYWAFLYDEDGLLMILDNLIIEGAIEDFIKYKVFEDLWLNNSIQDIERRYMVLKDEARMSKQKALYYISLLSFQSLLQTCKKQRNKFQKFDINNNRFYQLGIIDNLNILSLTNHLAFYNLYGRHEVYLKR